MEKLFTEEDHKVLKDVLKFTYSEQQDNTYMFDGGIVEKKLSHNSLVWYEIAYDNENEKIYKLKTLKDVFLYFRETKHYESNLKLALKEERYKTRDYIIKSEYGICTFDKVKKLSSFAVSSINKNVNEYLLKRNLPNIKLNYTKHDVINMFSIESDKKSFQTNPVIFKHMSFYVIQYNEYVYKNNFEGNHYQGDYDDVWVRFELLLRYETFDNKQLFDTLANIRCMVENGNVVLDFVIQ